MKLHLSSAPGLNLVSAHGVGFVTVGGRQYRDSLVISPDRMLTDWPAGSFDLLVPASFEVLLELGPELVILGTGSRHRFPHPSLYGALVAAGIGLEHMDTGAACRTYNILATEGRKVAAALIVEA